MNSVVVAIVSAIVFGHPFNKSRILTDRQVFYQRHHWTKVCMKRGFWCLVYDQNFYEGEGMVDGEGGSSERCLKWGGGVGVIKGSFQNHLKTGGG